MRYKLCLLLALSSITISTSLAKNYGDLPIDYALTFTAQTHDPSTGAAADVDSSGVPSYRIYEDETGTAILTGNMALFDDANTTGFYSEQVTLSAANGFENGKQYTIRVSALVGGVTGATSHSLSVSATRTNASLAATQTDPAAIRSAVGLTAANLNAQFSGLGASVSTAITQTTAANIRTAMGLAAADLDTQLDAIDIDAGLAATQTDAAAIRAAVGLTAANLNAQFSGLGASVSTAIAQTTAPNIRAAVGMTAADLDTQINLLSTSIGTVDTQTDAATIRSVMGLANADLDTQLDLLSTNIATVDTQTDAAAIRAAMGLASPDLDTQLAGVSGGMTQPRVNNPPTWRLVLSNRADATHTATRPVRLRPGTVGDIAVGIDVSPVFGEWNNVVTVGTPVVSGGSITATAEGPRDEPGKQYAIVALGGTATAGETQTVDVPVTMESGEQESVRFTISVFAD